MCTTLIYGTLLNSSLMHLVAFLYSPLYSLPYLLLLLLQMSTLLKENANLRSALRTVEQMKMKLENEKVAVQDQVR